MTSKLTKQTRSLSRWEHISATFIWLWLAVFVLWMLGLRTNCEDYAPAVRDSLRHVELFFVAGFFVDYLVRIIVASNRWRYMKSPMGAIDLACLVVLVSVFAGHLTEYVPASMRMLTIAPIFRFWRYKAHFKRGKNGVVDFGRGEILTRLSIFTWLALYTVQTFSWLHPDTLLALDYSTRVFTYLFLFEYLLRIILSTHARKYVFSPLGMIDFIVCLPLLRFFFPIDMEVIKILRFVRVFAIFKFGRFNEALLNIRDAFVIVRREFMFFGSVTLLLLYITSMGVYTFERAVQPDKFQSVFDGMWFAVVSLTTAGYGDVTPITPLGKVFTGLMLVIAVAVTAVSTGLISSAFTRVWDARAEALEKERHDFEKDLIEAEGQSEDEKHRDKD